MPTWTTNPELEAKSRVRYSSGRRQTWNAVWKAVSHASKTSSDRSCCAMTQTDGGLVWLSDPSRRAFVALRRNRHISLHIVTNGSTRASLYMQSHAMMVSKPSTSPLELDASDDTSSVSQSRALKTILLLICCGLFLVEPLFTLLPDM